MLQCGRSFRILIRQFINGHNIPITREHQELKDGRSNGLHCVHVTTSKEEVVIKLGIGNLIFQLAQWGNS